MITKCRKRWNQTNNSGTTVSTYFLAKNKEVICSLVPSALNFRYFPVNASVCLYFYFIIQFVYNFSLLYDLFIILVTFPPLPPPHSDSFLQFIKCHNNVYSRELPLLRFEGILKVIIIGYILNSLLFNQFLFCCTNVK